MKKFKILFVVALLTFAILSSCDEGNPEQTWEKIEFDISPKKGKFLGSVSKMIPANTGGTINWDNINGADDGEIIIPPNALASDTSIQVNIYEGGDNCAAWALVYDFKPDGLKFNKPVTANLTYSTMFSVTNNVDEDTLNCYLFSSVSECEKLTTTKRSTFWNEISCEIQHFSLLVIFDETLRKLFLQVPDVVDKYGKTLDNNAPFWKGGNKFIFIHGLTGSPSSTFGSTDLIPELENYYGTTNIAYYQYPSGAAISVNAKRLQEIIDNRATLSFKTKILAHSMGGLVSRCYIEKFRQSAKHSQAVEMLVTFGTPHEGSYWSNIYSWFKYTAGLSDMVVGSNFLKDLNRNANHDTIPYFTIYADDDLVVYDTSESGRYVCQPEQMFEADTSVFSPIAGHSQMHEESKTTFGKLLDKSGNEIKHGISVYSQVRDWIN